MQHQQSTPAPRKQLAAAGKKGPAPASSAAASAAAASSPLALNPSSVATSASTRSHNGGGRRPTIQYHKCSATHRGPNGNGNSTNGQMSVKMLEEAERALTSTVVGMLNNAMAACADKLAYARSAYAEACRQKERELRAAQDAHARVQADVRGLLNDTVELVAAVSRTLKLAPADVHGMLSVVSERCGGGEGEGGGAGKVVMNEEEAREEEPQRWQQQVNYETMNAEPDDSEEEEAEPFHALSPQQMQRKGRAAPGLVEPSSLSGSRKRVKMQHQQQGKEEEEQGRGMVVEGEEGEREGEEGDDEDDEGSMYEEGGEEDSLAADEDGSSSESDDEPPVGRNGSRRR